MIALDYCFSESGFWNSSSTLVLRTTDWRVQIQYLETQILKSHPDLLKEQLWGWGPSESWQTSHGILMPSEVWDQPLYTLEV